MKIIVKKTGNRGRGVFAARALRKGEFILSLKGKVISTEEMLAASKYHLDHMGAIGKDLCMIFGYPEKYINHSCSPNVFERNRELFAMKTIKKGEELFYDYAISDVDDQWSMRCKCGSRNCRKVINGHFFQLPLNIKVKYYPYLDDWFKKEFRHELKPIKRLWNDKCKKEAKHKKRR
ncbi:SET domain-containing protein-lysine N-methyltransferase [Candidatus Woesearchaeota archaeon]|nr:SET domain-containing protein-lysine N-methyltransferase [Candidatus Woesearchaeota archaeon]